MEPLYDIAIVGYGPVGCLAANLACRRGLKTVVIERATEIYPQPRAIGFDHEVMRVLQNLGLADRVLPYTVPYRPSVYRGADGGMIARFDFPPPPYPLSWSPNYAFSQPEFERCLREGASRAETLTTRLGEAALGLVQSEDVVRIDVQSLNGTIGQVAARYVLACDGAVSTIRKILGTELTSLSFDEAWLVVDMQLDDDTISLLPDTNVQYCEPERPCSYVVGPGNHRRWEIKLQPEEVGAALDVPEFVRRVLRRWMPDAAAVPWRAASYTFHALIAKQWQVGSVFLLGDAAHQTPPFMAQGMCQGIRDAANLIWKLDVVVHRGANPALLQTYQMERAPHVRATTQAAKDLGAIICERDPVAAAARDARMRAQLGDPPKTRIRQEMIPPLAEGFIDLVGGAPAGLVFPQPFVRNDDGATVLLDDVCGSGFRLVTTTRGAPWIDARVREWLHRLDAQIVVLQRSNDEESELADAVPIVESGSVLADWFERYGTEAVVVRPDHYVFAGAATHRDLLRVCEAATEQLGFRASSSLSRL